MAGTSSSTSFVTVYKYLDAQGGSKMLENSNLQFTNATKFNDPFDCHPALFDYSNAPTTKHNPFFAEFMKEKGVCDMQKLRNSTWICCMSKVYDSLLMWSYYNNHKGICIGLNIDAVIKCCQHLYLGTLPPVVAEVQYKDILKKTDYFKDHNSWGDLWTTKAKEWEHEQEVRLITKDPVWIHVGRNIPDEFKGEELVDGKEIRHYPQLTSDCFESLYLGIKIDKEKKEELIKVARKLNPQIKIYQMTTDPEAFKLKAEIIES